MLARTLTHLPDAGMQTSAFLVALYQGQGKITRLDSLTEPFKVWMSSPLDVWVTDQFTLQAYRVSPYLP